MAKSLGKTKFQIVTRNGSRDWAVPDAGVTYTWDWPNLKRLLA